MRLQTTSSGSEWKLRNVRGEEIEEDDGNGDDNDNDNDNDNDDEQQIEVQANDDEAVQGRCKICFDGQACMASLPCGHLPTLFRSNYVRHSEMSFV